MRDGEACACEKCKKEKKKSSKCNGLKNQLAEEGEKNNDETA